MFETNAPACWIATVRRDIQPAFERHQTALADLFSGDGYGLDVAFDGLNDVGG